MNAARVRGIGLALCAAGGLGVWEPALPADPPRDALRFTRVHVPRDGLADVPMGEDRYVPMPLPAFEAAAARATGAGDPTAGAPGSRAAAARYEARVTTDGRLVGRVAFDVGEAKTLDGPAPGWLPLGNLAVTGCTARTDAGVGTAVVFGQADGTVAVATADAGEYVAEFTAPPPRPTADGPLHVLPLVPAVRTTIRLRLPTGKRPLLAGHDLPPVRVAEDWLIEAGTRGVVEFHVVDEDPLLPGITLWSRIGISGREVAVDALVQPTTAWTADHVALAKDQALIVTDVSLAGSQRRAVAWSADDDGRSLTCLLPPVALATRTPLRIRAVGPLPDGLVRPLPTLRPAADRWAGGGALLEVDSALELAALDLARCLAVTAEAAAGWPLPGAAAEAGGAGGVLPARVYLEHQGPGAEARVETVPRTARLDVARLTVVDFAPGIVVGVANCEVSVRRGEAFDLTGLIAPGWFIDTVDAVGWSQSPLWLEPTTAPEARAAEPLEWKVVRDARGDVLRIGLAAAATPGRRLRLRIAGHRAGAAAGATFAADEIDMVRLVGESDGLAAVGFKTGAEQSADIVGANAGAIDPRLASLADDPAVRAWTPVGERDAAWQVQLVRRRPPLDVQAQVRVTVRDDRLSESFTFECRPDASDLDSLVVQFSEPMDDQLEWSLLAPANGSIAARRLESTAESWVVEFTPPVRDSVTIRAARSVSFTESVPIPLAWVEGAPRQVGEVIVRDAGRRRPRILNRRLGELPPRGAIAADWPTLVGEFSFTGVRESAGLPPAAELVPGRRDDGAARAWAWRETTSCWVYASGRTEFETAFEIENHGRETIVLGLPAGRRVQSVEIDGVPVTAIAEADVAAIPVDLPAGRSSFTLTVRSVTETGAWVAWRIDPAGVAIDLPVLDRLSRVAVPPDLEIAAVSSAWRGVGRASRAAPRSTPDAAFRVSEFVPAESPAASAIVVVRRRWLLVAAALAGLAVAVAALVAGSGRPWLPPALCVIAGVAALWCPAPADVVARAAWWSALGAALLTARWGALAGATVALATLGRIGGAPVEAGEDLRVFIAPLEDGEMALVPEPLYRVLVRAGDADVRPIRIVACRVSVPEPRPTPVGEERWRMAIDVDAAAAGVLTLGPQEAPDGWVVDAARIDGQAATVTGAPGRHAVIVPSAGRHRVEIDVRPRLELLGEVEMLAIALPPAPTALVELEARAGSEEGSAAGVWCEMAPPGGAFVAAPLGREAGGERITHDVSHAARVRIVRPQGPGIVLATAPPVVESRTTVLWDLGGCRVNAAFVVDPNGAVAAPCIVRADRGLAPVAPVDPTIDVAQLPGNRFLVRAARPISGPLRFELAFRRPLANPVGVFAVPGVWIEGAALDVRTTRLVPAGDLMVQVDAPAPLVMLAGDESAGATGGLAWRSEVRARDATAVDILGRDDLPAPFAGEPAARITVERRRQEIRGTQDVRVWFAPERTRITLEARVDASSAALVSLPVELPADGVVDSIALSDDGLQAPDSGARGPIDTHWHRTAPERGVLTVQRPQAGRFRLDVAVHVPRPPAETGRVPVARVLLPAAPAVVAWNEFAPASTQDRSWTLRSDERPPLYTLRQAPEAEPPEAAVAEMQPPAADVAEGEPRVELAEVELTLQDRGRAWGRARFDVVANDRVVRLALPRGMRLFDVFVDGQPTVPAVPGADSPPGDDPGGERWDIALHDVRWPRAIEVVYAGALGTAVDDDGPIVVAAPTLVGLPCSRRLWTLRAPRDAIVRVGDPALPLAPAALRQKRAEALAAIAADFERVIGAAPPPQRERLRAALEARLRRLDHDDRPGGGSLPGGSVTHVATDPADAPLTVRIARQQDPGVATRAWATLALLVVGGAVWVVVRGRGTRGGDATSSP